MASKVRLLEKYKNFLLDCDGVLWHSAHAIEGSVQAVERLRERGKVIFITNNASKSRSMYLEKFSKLGFDKVTVGDINTSGSAAAEYCKTQGFDRVFAIGEAGVLTECRNLGIDVIVSEGGAHVDDEEFEKLTLDPGVKAVVVGWDRSFNYRKLCLASLYLQAGAKLVACNPDSADKVGGRFMPGNGCSVAAIQYSVEDPQGLNTYVAGKPNGELVRALLDKYNLNPEETLMVGDRLDTDCQFGKNGGIDSLLVLSGCTSLEQLEEFQSEALGFPTYVAPDLASALELEF